MAAGTIEHHGETGLRIAGTPRRPLKLGKRPTIIRLIDCRNAILEDLFLFDPQGPADPDGSCIQLIRSTATIRRCKFLARPGMNDACDLFSNFADEIVEAEPVDEESKALVLLEDCQFIGRGPIDASTSIINDGEFPPPLLARRCTIRGARVGIMQAGGNMRFEGCTVEDCDEQTVWSDGKYYARARKLAGQPVRPGPLELVGCTLDRKPGKGKLPGRIEVSHV